MKNHLVKPIVVTLFVFLLSSLFTQSVFAQTAKISGLVTAENGDPLIGATVEITELSLGGTTDLDGKYMLEIPADKTDGSSYTLTVRYVGYGTYSQSITASAGNQTYDLTLTENVLTLAGVEVTALKAGTTLATETPMSISAFTGKLIESSGANTIADFIQNAPGVTTTQLDEGFMALQIRGISTLSGDSPAGYYLDELPFTFIGSPLVPDINPFDMERVEVLRGPQGTLYGNGAQSGVVRILTKNADPTRFGFKADIMGANTHEGGANYGGQGALNIPIVKDKLALRLVGGYRQMGGYLTNNLLGTKEINESKLTHFRGKINFRPNDDLSIRASVWTQNNDVGTYALADDDYDHSTPFEEINTNEFILYNGTIEYHFPKLNIYSSTSYSDLKSQTYDGSPIFARSDTDISQKALNEEFRLSSNYDGAINWLAGLYYWDGTFNQTTGITFPLPDGTFFLSPYLDSKSTSTQFAGFGELYIRLLDNRLQATVGLRYYTEERTLEDLLPTTVETLKLLGLEPKRSTNYKVMTPRFNLAFNPQKNTLVYATASNGFRSGLVQNGAFLVSGIAFGISVPEFVNEENLWSYEVGTKITSSDKKYLIEAALYYNDWSDLIQTSSEIVDAGGVPTPIIFFINAGKASAVGLDVNTQFSNQKGFTLTLGGNVNNSEYKDDTPATLGAKDGDRISFVPKFTISSSAQYKHKLAGNLAGSVYANLQHNSERIDYREGMEVSGDANTMLNARIGVEGKKWGIFLFGNNLLNERGATYPHNLLTYDTRLRPRTLGINLKINY